MGSSCSTTGGETTLHQIRMEEEKIAESLPEKSKSLRRTSVKKRLQTEIKKINPAVKEKVSKKRLLSKYRRKTANAKVRERMKKMNDVFATLKSVIPADGKADNEEEKETKVTTLRSAISYINCLKQLIEDCDAGLVENTDFIENDENMNKSDKVTDHDKKVSPSPKKTKNKKILKNSVKSKVK